MPCNPSVGGPAKGIVVREIDALGGQWQKLLIKLTFKCVCLIQVKVQLLELYVLKQIKVLYQQSVYLRMRDNWSIMQGMVDELIIEDNEVKGVRTNIGTEYRSKAVIITTGTFLRGEIILGNLKYSSGPNHQLPFVTLADNLRKLGFDIVRFKTGTPPRVNARTIDYSKTEIQPGDDIGRAFSFETTEFILNQLPCWLTYTNGDTHQVIDDNLHLSAMYSGMIKGTGPRYCPSIEDKFVRF